MYLHYKVKPGSSSRWVSDLSNSSELTTFVYILKGQGLFGREKKPIDRAEMAAFESFPSKDASETISIDFENKADASEDLEFVLIGGKPIGEPIARYGPFVMNTQEEIKGAFAEYRSGKLGSIH